MAGLSTQSFRAFPSKKTHSEIDLRQELINTIDGSYPEIAKGRDGLLRKMRRNSLNKLIPCDCVDPVTHEPDRDSFCPLCIKSGTFIPTIHGAKQIQEIIPGEYVLAGDGNYHLVTNTSGKLYHGNIVSIYFRGRGNIPLEATEDHKIFVFRPDQLCYHKKYLNKLCHTQLCGNTHCKLQGKSFSPKIIEMQADQIRPGDYIVMPKPKYNPEKVITNLEIKWEKYLSAKGKDPLPIANNINIDKDLMYFLGFYVAEGSGCSVSRKTRTVVFSLHEKEYDIGQKLIQISEQKFGISGKIEHTKTGKGIKVSICNAVLSRWLHDICGRYSDFKKSPYFIWRILPELQQEYIKAFMLGDGHRDAQDWQSSRVVSRQLIEEIYILATMNNFFPSIRFQPAYISSDGNNHKDSWSIEWLDTQQESLKEQPPKWRWHFEQNEYIFMQVKEIRTKFEQCVVYDLSVEKEHSFVANGVLVHNCYSEGYLWDETPLRFYKVIVSDQKDFIQEEFRSMGTDKIPLVNFYLEYNVPITEDDKIVELALDIEGTVLLPKRRSAIYRINSLADLRSDYGRLEYWKAKTVKEDVKYLNHPSWK